MKRNNHGLACVVLDWIELNWFGLVWFDVLGCIWLRSFDLVWFGWFELPSAGVGVLLEDKLDRVKIVKKLGKVSNLEAASKVVVRSDTFFFRVFENSKHLLKYRPKNQRLVLLILGGQLMEHPQIVTLILTITKPVRSRSFTTVSSRITVP